MGKIIAIGGGEIGRPGYPVETLEIDREIVSLTGKKRPNVLFLPTASGDSESYYKVVQEHFGKRLGCTTDVLYLIKEKYSRRELQKRILEADVIYVGGGNTLKMLKIWRKTGVDIILKEAYDKNIVLAGISAGAICWFKYGSSDSMRFAQPKNKKLIRVTGLGFIPLLVSPHHIRELHRRQGILELMKRTSGIGIALDDYCALEIVDGKYRIITSKPIAKAHKVYYEKGKERYLPVRQEEFMPLEQLLKR